MDSLFSWSTDYYHPTTWDQFHRCRCPTCSPPASSGGATRRCSIFWGASSAMPRWRAAPPASPADCSYRASAKAAASACSCPNVPPLCRRLLWRARRRCDGGQFLTALYRCRTGSAGRGFGYRARCSRSVPPRCCPALKCSTGRAFGNWSSAPGRGRATRRQVRPLPPVQTQRGRGLPEESACHPLLGARRQ